MVVTSSITINSTDKVPEFTDITDFVVEKVSDSGVKTGIVNVFSQHTTAAIVVQEMEPGFHQDVQELLSQMFPKESKYHHTLSPEHIEDKRPNGHSHMQHLFMGGSSTTIPVQDSKMLLGRYQRIFIVELDRARLRNVIVQVVGE